MHGLHLTADLHGCAPAEPGLCTDPDALRRHCLQAVADAGLQAVGDAVPPLPGAGRRHRRRAAGRVAPGPAHLARAGHGDAGRLRVQPAGRQQRPRRAAAGGAGNTVRAGHARCASACSAAPPGRLDVAQDPQAGGASRSWHRQNEEPRPRHAPSHAGRDPRRTPRPGGHAALAADAADTFPPRRHGRPTSACCARCCSTSTSFPSGCTTRKRAQLLFPRLRAAGARTGRGARPAGPGTRARRDRDPRTRARTAGLRGDGRPAPRDAFEAAAERYVGFYLDHMRIEETEVLPAATRHFTRRRLGRARRRLRRQPRPADRPRARRRLPAAVPARS